MDRLLRGDITPAGGCDIKTLAKETDRLPHRGGLLTHSRPGAGEKHPRVYSAKVPAARTDNARATTVDRSRRPESAKI